MENEVNEVNIVNQNSIKKEKQNRCLSTNASWIKHLHTTNFIGTHDHAPCKLRERSRKAVCSNGFNEFQMIDLI